MQYLNIASSVRYHRRASHNVVVSVRRWIVQVERTRACIAGIVEVTAA
jgi:hypothetical protein